MNSIIFASTSSYKQQQLSSLGLNFKAVDSHLIEKFDDTVNHQSLALQLSAQKAQAIEAEYPNALILGSDQVAVNNNGAILTKPGSKDTAIKQLLSCSGKTASFYSAITLLKRGQLYQDCTRTDVCFRQLSLNEIERYVDFDKPFDCAGSFKVESLGISLFERIDTSDPTALIGLPLIALCNLLRVQGIAIP